MNLFLFTGRSRTNCSLNSSETGWTFSFLMRLTRHSTETKCLPFIFLNGGHLTRSRLLDIRFRLDKDLPGSDKHWPTSETEKYSWNTIRSRIERNGYHELNTPYLTAMRLSLNIGHAWFSSCRQRSLLAAFYASTLSLATLKLIFKLLCSIFGG